MRIEHLAEHPHLVPTVAQWSKDEWGHLCPEVPYEDYVSSFQKRTIHNSIPETLVALEGDTLLGTASIIEHVHPHGAFALDGFGLCRPRVQEQRGRISPGSGRDAGSREAWPGETLLDHAGQGQVLQPPWLAEVRERLVSWRERDDNGV